MEKHHPNSKILQDTYSVNLLLTNGVYNSPTPNATQFALQKRVYFLTSRVLAGFKPNHPMGF